MTKKIFPAIILIVAANIWFTYSSQSLTKIERNRILLKRTIRTMDSLKHQADSLGMLQTIIQEN